MLPITAPPDATAGDGRPLAEAAAVLADPGGAGGVRTALRTAVRLRALHLAEGAGLVAPGRRPPLARLVDGHRPPGWHREVARDLQVLADAAPTGTAEGALPGPEAVLAALALLAGDAAGDPPPDLAPDLDRALGLLHDPDRRATGAYYTPASLARSLVDVALDVTPHPAPRLLDPACGTGAFLLAALDRLAPDRHRLADRRRALQAVLGVDVDPLAVEAARLSLWLAVGDPELPLAEVAARVQVADALGLAAEQPSARPARPAAGVPAVAQPATWDALLRTAWPEAAAVGDGPHVDVVVGNPPFRTPLTRAGDGLGARRAALAARLGDVVRPCTDDAWLFLALAWSLVAHDGGSVALVQPTSVLAARDAAPVRERLTTDGHVAAAWLDDGRAFDAGVGTCAVVAVRGRPTDGRHDVRRHVGVPPRAAGTAAPPPGGGAAWGALLADLLDVPPSGLVAATGVLGDEVVATADFRDRYYALRGRVVEAPTDLGAVAPPWAPLLTAGLIDPAAPAWGRRPARLHGRRWAAPALLLDGLDDDLVAWVGRRAVPKVLVAQQTRVVEAVADPEGRLLPSVPVVSVLAPAERCWHVLAALLSPPVAAWAAERSLGTGRAAGTVRLRPADVRAVPRPLDDAAWDRGADLAAAAQAAGAAGDAAGWRQAMAELGTTMAAAHGVDDPALQAWWWDRLPTPAP